MGKGPTLTPPTFEIRCHFRRGHLLSEKCWNAAAFKKAYGVKDPLVVLRGLISWDIHIDSAWFSMILLPLSKQLEYETPSRKLPWELSPRRPMASRRASFGEDVQALRSKTRMAWICCRLSWFIMIHHELYARGQGGSAHHAPSLQNQKIATGSRGRALCDRFSKVLISLMTLLMHPRHGDV
jgi:hypothetical protein